MPSKGALEVAVAAHGAALAAQAEMRRAAHERDVAVQAARTAGVPAAELAAALGVNRHRIHAMLKAAEQAPDDLDHAAHASPPQHAVPTEGL